MDDRELRSTPEAKRPLSRSQNPATRDEERTEKTETHPIVWAIDPFDDDPDRAESLLRALSAWQKAHDSTILPISVVSPIDLNWPIELMAPYEEKLYYLVHGRLAPYISKAHLENSVEPRILVSRESSRRSAARALVDLAKKEGARIIAINTHGRSGFNRLRLGSFAETIVAVSEIPVLVVGPKMQVSPRVRSILFPTDFSQASRKFFKSVVLDWAARFRAAVTVLHVFDAPVPPMAFGELGVGVDAELIEKVWASAAADQRETARKWAEEGRQRGVECEFLVTKEIGAIGSRIVSEAERRSCDVIAMASEQGPVSRAFFGSVVRDVLMQAGRPVLVAHIK